MGWKDEELDKVYTQDWVQPCEPTGDESDPDRDIKGKYHFFHWEEGGRWEAGIDEPPRKWGPRDRQIVVGSYWAFKIRDIVEFKMPSMHDNELLQKRQKIIDDLFEMALALQDKKELGQRLTKRELDAKAFEKVHRAESERLAELRRILEELRKDIASGAKNAEAAEAIEGLFRRYEKVLEEKVEIESRRGVRLSKEIEYLKFRCAEYDMATELDQRIEKVQKKTAESEQWRKMLPLLPLKKPEQRKRMNLPREGLPPSRPRPTMGAPGA
jgi:hypothetical protein